MGTETNQASVFIKGTVMTITEAIGDTVIGCYSASETALNWVQIECVDDSFLHNIAPTYVHWLTYFS